MIPFNSLSQKHYKSEVKKWFKQLDSEGNPVVLKCNTRYSIQLKDNKILQSLLKEKYIKLIRVSSKSGPFWNTTKIKNISYLVINN